MIKNKEEELLDWCLEKRLFNYIDIKNYSMNNFYLRAERTIRDFVTEGKIKRISDDEAVLRGLRKPGRACIAWFEII